LRKFKSDRAQGAGPYSISGLILGPDGGLYGTNANGGDLNCADGDGCGTVFRLK